MVDKKAKIINHHKIGYVKGSTGVFLQANWLKLIQTFGMLSVRGIYIIMVTLGAGLQKSFNVLQS